jgi:hypothetical protein
MCFILLTKIRIDNYQMLKIPKYPQQFWLPKPYRNNLHLLQRFPQESKMSKFAFLEKINKPPRLGRERVMLLHRTTAHQSLPTTVGPPPIGKNRTVPNAPILDIFLKSVNPMLQLIPQMTNPNLFI